MELLEIVPELICIKIEDWKKMDLLEIVPELICMKREDWKKMDLLEMVPELIRGLEAVADSVTEAGQSEDLEELVRAVELTGKVALLQVQPEELLHNICTYKISTRMRRPFSVRCQAFAGSYVPMVGDHSLTPHPPQDIR